MNKTYNGWSNYQTWAVKLWMDNENGMESLVMDLKENFECDSAYELGEVIKNEIVEPRLDELNIPASMFSDLLNNALSEVNWTEIAESYLED